MDGGAIRDVLSVRHIFNTLREIIFDPASFVDRVKEGSSADITRPIPYITACLFVLSIAYKIQGKASPLSALSTLDQLELIFLFLLPFAILFHIAVKLLEPSSEATFAASITVWLYILGLLSLVFSVAVVADPIIRPRLWLSIAVVALLMATILLLAYRVVSPLYGVTEFADVRKPMISSAFLAWLLFKNREWIYQVSWGNPFAWLAAHIDPLLR